MKWIDNLYRDDDRGEFTGNILLKVAALFPPAVGEQITSRHPLATRWRLMVRTMKSGSIGHFFEVDPSIVPVLRGVFQDVFRGYPRDEEYPDDIYNPDHNEGLPKVCLAITGSGHLTVWLPASPLL